MVKYDKHPRFDQQLKKLLKKYRSLEEDLEIAKRSAIELFHVHGRDNNSVEVIPGFDRELVKVFKVKKFACKSLHGKGVKSGIRLIYAFFPEGMKVVLLEIYYKTKDDTDMDYGFIKEYFSEVRKEQQ